MNKRTIIIAVVAAILALGAIPFAYAQHGDHGRHADGFGAFGLGRLDKIKTALNLTDEQTAQLQQIAADLRAQNAPLRHQARGTMLQVAQTLLNDPNNTAAAQQLLDQQSANERLMKQNVLNAASKAITVLTPDQRAKVADFLNKRAAAHQQQ
jgi:Spy/CpxP family protein refolding chaperone